MKLSLVTEKFNQALSLVGRIVSSRTTLPILSNVMIRTDDGEVLVEATDLEIAVSYKLGGKIEAEGGITVPAKLLSRFISGLDSETVELESEKNGNVLDIESGKTKTSIDGTDTEEFPVIPQVEGKEILEIDPALLSDALEDVNFAVSSDESRMVLTGVLFEVREDELVLVGTDSYRLAEKRIKPSDHLKLKNKTRFILPGRTAKEAGRILKGEKMVKLVATETQAALVGSTVEIVSRLVDGEFPDYENIIPDNFKGTAEFETKRLGSTISQAMLFAQDSSNTLNLDLQDKEMKIEAESSDVGEYETELENLGEEVSLDFTVNGRFLDEGLNALSNTEKVSVSVVDSSSPVVMESEDKENYRYLVMPMKS